MNTVTRVQILDEAESISHKANTLGNGINPIILLPAMGKKNTADCALLAWMWQPV